MKRNILTLLLAAVTFNAMAATPIQMKESTTKHGPEKGSLIIIGGGLIPADVWGKFTELAGGVDKANIVVVTTAAGDSAGIETRTVNLVRKETGIKKVTLLHTKDLQEANSEKFTATLKNATGVFFEGGRQWLIADSYLNTLTHQAFWDVLNRGGVIAGTSAGASIQGSFLWRGDTSGAQITVGDHTQGLGFLKNSVIDQHILRRNRQFDLINVIKESPKLIGIGLDESTAIVVQRDTFEVIGKSYVAVYDYNTIVGNGERHVIGSRENYAASSGPFFFLSRGQKYDLSNRQVIREPRRQNENQTKN
jgi:Cyanophycinase and related exopeptidases